MGSNDVSGRPAELPPPRPGGAGVAQQQPGSGSNSQMSTSTLSVLDCMWDLLQDAPRLLKEKPQPIASALQ
eukprot:scaffold680300_cov37-Prasinocladus_malaysianus.AAC.1